VNVTDSVGVEVESNVAVVTVNPLPSVSILPTSVTLDVSQSQKFVSSVSGGTVPYSYQWYLNGTAFPLATNSTWTVTPLSSGSYSVYVNVTDSVGVEVESNVAVVTVNPLPSVSILPASAALDVGQSQTFTSTVSNGTSPFSYQWYLNGSASAAASTWTFSPSSQGTYTVYINVTDYKGVRVQSNTVTMTVDYVPTISISPTSAALDVGQSQLFNSSVHNGTSPFSYQWYLNGATVPGATGSTWTFIPLSSGSYSVYVNVTDGVGVQAESNAATVRFNPVPFVSISPPFVTLDVGQSQTFTLTASNGTSPFSYQWYLNGTAVSGATGSTWAFSPTSSGSFAVYVTTIDNAGYPANSNIANVVVSPTFSVDISPSAVVLSDNQSQLFSSTVTGGTALYTYQWYVNGAPVAGATNATWNFTLSSAGAYTIYAKASDSAETQATSNTATVNYPVSVFISPTSVTLDVGQSELFTSNVSGGAAPYSYQWYLNGTAVSGATGSTWTFIPLSSGSYSVYLNITDNLGVLMTSTPATVTVSRVIPELPATLILPLFLIATLMTAIIYKRKHYP
jgi:hypothetical protein